MNWSPGAPRSKEIFESTDWSKHPLGPREKWPAPLKVAIELIFHSQIPMYVWWGPRLYQFYNEPVLKQFFSDTSEHAACAMGQPAVECWPDMKDEIERQVANVFSFSEETWTDDVAIAIPRNGVKTETYWRFGHTPLIEESGSIGGILVLAIETTDRVREMQARKQAEETLLRNQEILMQNEERFRIAMSAANLATWDIDMVTDSGLVSKTSSEMFDLEENAPTSLTEGLKQVYPEDLPIVLAGIQKASDPHGNGLFHVEHRVLRPGEPDRPRWVSGVGKMFFAGEGESRRPVRFVGTVMDISDKIERIESLQKAKDAADSANRLKSAFVANMSHEIRTPLSSILGFSELLKERVKNDPEARQFLDIILKNGHALSHLIGDILDLSKIEANRLQIEMAPLNLEKIVAEVVGLFDYKLKSTGVVIETHFNRSVPARLVSDPARLRQILVNVVGNAVKFTAKGQIQILVHATKWQDADKYNVQIAVKDSGLGMTEEQQKLLFQPFVQCDSSVTRQFGGTGLGLALSRRLARALDGDIVISESRPGRGSTFTISFTAQTPRAEHDEKEVLHPF